MSLTTLTSFFVALFGCIARRAETYCLYRPNTITELAPGMVLVLDWEGSTTVFFDPVEWKMVGEDVHHDHPMVHSFPVVASSLQEAIHIIQQHAISLHDAEINPDAEQVMEHQFIPHEFRTWHSRPGNTRR